MLIVISALLIWLIYTLPKVVVENDGNMTSIDSTAAPDPHMEVPRGIAERIQVLEDKYLNSSSEEKSAIFADSLADLYAEAGKFDSAGWYAEQAATFFNSEKSLMKAGDKYYQAFTFSMDEVKQGELAEKSRVFFNKVLAINPRNLEAKSKMAMTYVSSANPMQGIVMLREVLEEDPKNESALFNLGMLSIQSGQHERAVERLSELVTVNPKHLQGQLLLGIAYMNLGNKTQARQQFEKVKDMDKDPAVQATVDSYLKDLK